MYIEQVTIATEELWDAFRRLIPQLTSNNPPPSQKALADLVNSESSCLLIARSPQAADPIIGAACLTVYLVPTGIRAIIEDVVVDKSARRQGIGEALIRRCLEIAQVMGASAVTLTSSPRREAANRLYMRMGFTRRETNAYIYEIA